MRELSDKEYRDCRTQNIYEEMMQVGCLESTHRARDSDFFNSLSSDPDAAGNIKIFQGFEAICEAG